MCEVLDKAEARGEEKANLANIRSLMETMNLNPRQAMDALKIPASEQKKYEARL